MEKTLGGGGVTLFNEKALFFDSYWQFLTAMFRPTENGEMGTVNDKVGE